MRLYMKCVFMVLSPLLIDHTKTFNILRQDLIEAKAKAARRQGQAWPRLQNFGNLYSPQR